MQSLCPVFSLILGDKMVTNLPIEPDNPQVEYFNTRYKRAQYIIRGICSNNLVLNTTIVPTWIGTSDCFWYKRDTKTGKKYCLVDAKAATNKTAFDHRALAAALADITQQEVNQYNLPIQIVEIKLNPTQVCFLAFNKQWLFDVNSETCQEIEVQPERWATSPDGSQTLFVRDYNLWVRNNSNSEERPLTRDGEEDYAYGAFGSAWGMPSGVSEANFQALWSPNGKQVLTIQRDRRKVKQLPVIHHVPQDGSIRPTVEFTKVAYPGDEHIETLRILAIDINSGYIQAANYRQIPVTRHDWGFIDSNLGWWGSDSRRAYFVDVERDYKTARVVEFDTTNGEVKTLFKETSDTQINLMLNGDERPTFMPLPGTNELLWFSERSGWAHLYLYDLDTGDLKNAITQGNWVVRDIVHFDTNKREVFIQTGGRTPGRDPYYRDLIRVQIDTGEITTIAASNHEYVVLAQKNFTVDLMKEFGMEITNNACGVSQNGDFAVVTRSRANEAPVNLLMDKSGNEVLEIESADLSGLPEQWQWPEPVKLLADDGKTDIYGLVYRPSDFSPDKLYPVIDHVFCNPEYPFVSKGSFSNGIVLGLPYFNAAALAELGFIVVQIDGRGISFRDKAFQDVSYGFTASASNLDDHVTGIRQLAKRYPYMDLNRVGISAHLGGIGAVQGLLHHPDFYKVGVTVWMQDSRLMAASMWGDKLESVNGPVRDHQYPEELVHNLEGKLLLMGGMLDRCTPPASIFRLVEALYKADKVFDMLLLPNSEHDIDMYFIKRTWDYFVKHLLNVYPIVA